MTMESFLEYTVKGTLVIIGIIIAIPLLSLYAAGKLIVYLLERIYQYYIDHKPETIAQRKKRAQEFSEWYMKQLEEKRLKEEMKVKKRAEFQLQLEQYYKQKEEQEQKQAHVEVENAIKKYNLKKKSIPKIKPLETDPLIQSKGKYYREQELAKKEKTSLQRKGYKLFKISPYGTTGAYYYWIKQRYNESGEHAFFCYLTEKLLKKHIRKLELNTTYGPDVVFNYKGKEYCFEIETGKNLTKHPKESDYKLKSYKEEYSSVFILILRKSLKYKYTKYGIVITRAKLKETIFNIFQQPTSLPLLNSTN